MNTIVSKSLEENIPHKKLKISNMLYVCCKSYHINVTIIDLSFGLSNKLLILTPWLTEPDGLMPHSQGLSNNPYPEPNQPNSSH